MLKLEPPPVESVEKTTRDFAYLVGATGTTTSRCVPLGKALIGDQYFDVLSPDDLLEPETEIQVYDVLERTIFGRRVPSNDTLS